MSKFVLGFMTGVALVYFCSSNTEEIDIGELEDMMEYYQHLTKERCT